MSKKTEKKVNLYGNYRPQDSAFFNKIDEKLAVFQKQNKKYALEFYANAKDFVLNAIEIKKSHKVGSVEKLPKRFLDLINDRDIDRLYDGFISDTKAVAKELFSEEMSTEEICACAIEYVRLCSSNFARFESESQRKEQSELAEMYAKGYNGILSFYFGCASDIDRGQLLARLINCGIDIKHSIAYAECVVDAYGDAITQIIEFKGKPIVAISAYNGVAKSYAKTTEKMSKMYQFIDFSASIPNARKRALKAFKKYHNCKGILNKTSNLENALEELANTCYKNMSDLTPCEQNMLVKVGDKVIKFDTLVELTLYDRQKEFELIPDLFDPNLATIKVNIDETGRFKVFPNKVIDEEYNLNSKKSYILNKLGNIEKDDSKPNDDFAESLSQLDEQTELSMQSESSYKPVNIDNVTPMSSSQVLENLQVKFTPKEEQVPDFSFDGVKFDLSQAEMFALGEAKSVDLDQAEKERLLFEKEMGISTGENAGENINTTTPKKKKSFYDMLDEISEKVQKTRAQKLQERYQEMQDNGAINQQLDSGNVENYNLNQDDNEEINKELENSGLNEQENENVNITAKNDNITAEYDIDSADFEQDEVNDNDLQQEKPADIEMNPDFEKYEQEYDEIEKLNRVLYGDDIVSASKEIEQNYLQEDWESKEDGEQIQESSDDQKNKLSEEVAIKEKEDNKPTKEEKEVQQEVKNIVKTKPASQDNKNKESIKISTPPAKPKTKTIPKLPPKKQPPKLPKRKS